MRAEQDLCTLLHRIDGRSYPAYRELRGTWALTGCRLCLDHIQGDPFAAPSRLRLRLPTDIDPAICADPIQRMAAEDWLLRQLITQLDQRTSQPSYRPSQARGSGRSGVIEIYRPGPEIIRRSALILHPGEIEIRLEVGLPARGRRVLGSHAEVLLTQDLPRAVQALSTIGDAPALAAQIQSVQIQQHLRGQLLEHGLVAFVADGSVLPRASGVAHTPLPDAIPILAPETLAISLPTPWGQLRGLGIRAGITAIVGGGFHGKSTLLRALSRAHMDHIPGDGRERVVSLPSTVTIRAEDGRAIHAVNISPFLSGMPDGRSTTAFTTSDASGSTSQAAAIVEAIESRARLLLIDEDTSATNLLVSDPLMRMLIIDEPITPLVQRIRGIYQRHQVSTLIVTGGVSGYLQVADQIISMERWRPVDRTEEARAICADHPAAPSLPMPPRAIREICQRSLVPTGRGRIRARDHRQLALGDEEIDISGLSQIVDTAYAASIGHAIRWLSAQGSGWSSLDDMLDAIEAALHQAGVQGAGSDLLAPHSSPSGALIWPRRQDLAAAISRLRSLDARSSSHPPASPPPVSPPPADLEIC